MVPYAMSPCIECLPFVSAMHDCICLDLVSGRTTLSGVIEIRKATHLDTYLKISRLRRSDDHSDYISNVLEVPVKTEPAWLSELPVYSTSVSPSAP